MDGNPKRKSLIVEGWRFVPHSYAIVNQWQLLSLLTRSISVRIVDMPLHRAAWRTEIGLFEPWAEQALRSIAIARPDESADVTLRIVAPFSFAPSRSRLTAVFATLEQQAIRAHQLSDKAEYHRLQESPPPPHVKAVTPSRWSAEGFYRAGFAAEQVIIVPHGVDAATFHPKPQSRGEIRGRLGIPEEAFVFLSVGAMSGNKGIDLLLRGFAAICHRFPHAQLVLKGVDRLYGSKDRLQEIMQRLPGSERQCIGDRVTYLGGSLPHREVAALYQAADAYVSPYRAEGFNLPVLEAAACGLPVICTRGGPTDDFVTDAFARRIESRTVVAAVQGQELCHLEPSLEHLTQLMGGMIADEPWRRRAAEAGPGHVRARYTWDRVTDGLIHALLD